VHAEWLGFLSTEKFRFFWAVHSLILIFFGFGFVLSRFGNNWPYLEFFWFWFCFFSLRLVAIGF
jgi:hypothetical protein